MSLPQILHCYGVFVCGRHNCTTARPWVFLWVLLLLPVGLNSLSRGQSLSRSQTMVSEDGTFELGFFTPGTSHNMYLGIWYKNRDKAIVWVANRDKPLVNSSLSRLEFSEDGNLVLQNESQTIWSTNSIVTAPASVEAVLLDSGNFVLRYGSRSPTMYWQSFDHPTDTWLPGAKLGIDKRTGKIQLLTSWKNPDDPSPGLFSVGIDPGGSNEYVMKWNMSTRYWSSGVWQGQFFNFVPELSHTYRFNFFSDENETYFTYSLFNPVIVSRLVVTMSGQLNQQVCHRDLWSWESIFVQPKEPAYCGPFGISSKNLLTFCKCLQGFEPYSTENTRLDQWSYSCVRRAPLQCEDNPPSKGNRDGFLHIPDVKLPADPTPYPAQSLKTCKSACMQNCSCKACAYSSTGCSMWFGALLNMQELRINDNNKQDIYLKLAASELPGNRTLLVIISVLVSLTVLVPAGVICFVVCKGKRKKAGEKDLSKDFLSYDFDGCNKASADDKNIDALRMGADRDVELPLFSFSSVSAATANFSADNKLGEGGFGPVYKAQSFGGQELAVKRLSKRSGQGLEEFRNEIGLISKLQHRNLVRVLGCCIEQDEKLLIYEYMPNKSLDSFIFDLNKKQLLDWRMRIGIVEGIAQGLLYLHQYSRFRIIHRDLKASNILLDGEMNPKISDFGMARIFGGNESEANTNRVVGTFGYMAPEYAMEGLFSVKSDVFSFGVLLLEIVSGKKNTGFYNKDPLNLLGHAWGMWNADRALDLIDSVLVHPSSASTLLRYINIGLLCVQENPSDRPTMSDIVSMLSNDLAALPTPKQPAFCTSRSVMKANSSANSTGNCSVNGLTISRIEPR